LQAAKALGADSFDLVGHSMGAFVGLELANMAPKRLRRFVLIDAVGVPDPRAMPPIFAAAQRLGQTHESVEAFLGAVKRAGIVPFDAFWEAHYREDLVEAPGGGVKQRASLDAIMEDMAYAGMTNVRALWPGVVSKALLLRAGISMGPGGDIITEHDRDTFLRTAREASAAEIPANHYGIMTHPDTAKRIEEFLR
jgi:pimeloyl-ACP methyl ester carboxylesterase